jgi:hypothetical protein
MYDQNTLTGIYDLQVECMKDFSNIEKDLYNNVNKNNIRKFRSIEMKKGAINKYCTHILSKNFITEFPVIRHQLRKNNEILNTLHDRIIFFNSKTMGILQALPEEILFNIFKYLDFNSIYTFSKTSINSLLIVNKYREHRILSTNKEDDISYQKYLDNKNNILDQERYMKIDPLTIQKNILYILDPYNYCEVTFNYI